ncbi:MAG: flagellar basal body-associated FliL family protein [Desulfobacter sp.]
MAEDLLEEIEESDGTEEINVDSEDASPEKKSLLKKLTGMNKKIMIIAGIALLVIVIGVGAGVFFFSGGEEAGTENAPPETAQLTEEEIQAALEQQGQVIFEDIVVLEPFERISLKGSSAMGLISLGISLELTDHRYRRQMYTMEDRIRKIVIGQVREMTWLELRSPEGKIKLKYALLKRMNSIFPKVTVRNVYFTNFLMQ